MSSTQSPSLINLSKNLRPHILMAMLRSSYRTYFINKEITIVGDVCNIVQCKNYIIYNIDDGSGRVTCKQWKKNNFTLARLGALMQITGQLQQNSWGNIELLVIQMVDKTNFPTIELIHWMLSIEYYQRIFIPCLIHQTPISYNRLPNNKPINLNHSDAKENLSIIPCYDIAKSIKSYLHDNHRHSFTGQELLCHSHIHQKLLAYFHSGQCSTISDLLLQSIKQMLMNGWIYCQDNTENNLNCCYQLIDDTDLYHQINGIVLDLCQYRECIHLKEIYRNLCFIDKYQWVAKSIIIKSLHLLVANKKLICIQGSYFTSSPQ